MKKAGAKKAVQKVPEKVTRVFKKRPSNLEKEVSQHIDEIAASFPELRLFKCNKISTIAVPDSKEAVVLSVPNKLYKLSKVAHTKLVAALEKKTKKFVFIVNDRKIYREDQKPKGMKVRPIANTRRFVENELLEEISRPVPVVGKRITYFQKGGQNLRVQLEPKERAPEIEERLPAFAAVYKKMTNKNVEFVFPVQL
eukprot:GHVP01037665.1.p1 GENE.GHVP01037665.1~~GHVP01037665.1.p1  ORF type:complete len:197 (-),score=37.62 GHVP01037665.1:222-812(-)